MKNVYASARSRAWRNLLVAAANEAIRRGVFSPGAPGEKVVRTEFTFTVGGRGVEVCVSDAGYGEVGIVAVLDPDHSCRYRLLTPINPKAGAAVALGWIERQRGQWLMTPKHTGGSASFRSTSGAVKFLAAADAVAIGFADRGAFIL